MADVAPETLMAYVAAPAEAAAVVRVGAVWRAVAWVSSGHEAGQSVGEAGVRVAVRLGLVVGGEGRLLVTVKAEVALAALNDESPAKAADTRSA